jgi:hypothetical protein
MLHRTSSGCCEKDIGSSKAHVAHFCEHGQLYLYTKPLKRSAPLRRVSEKRETQARRRGSTLKQGRGFAVTNAQREKVKGLPCANCGREASEYVAIDPAHLSKRGSQGGCDHVLCIVPLCRDINGGCHIPFDKGELDIYPALQTKGYWAEMAHAIEAHQVSPSLLVTRLSGGRWELVEVSKTTKEAVVTDCPERSAA